MENDENARNLSAIESIEFCDPDVYPNLYILFNFFLTLPISIATVERSFHTLRRIKTWLRKSVVQ